MSGGASGATTSSGTLRRAFLGWQCRVRQHAVRRGDGRPTPGMRPRAILPGGGTAGPFTTVMVLSEPAHVTTAFRHMHRTAGSPLERYEAVMRVLQGSHYQMPEDFSDTLTALFNTGSATAEELVRAAACRLEFGQFGQAWSFECAVRALDRMDLAYEATYWHNALFNPRLGADVQVLAFVPDWRRAHAEPAVPG